ncbi:TIGR02466 family protein [Winogradskya humida]|uniref:2-oxoglutarate-Fe(II)-dependent oxygenase superfamily protein n=1 Tax=Winogradskya humida TaxID=113566 RepID=A0ABQ3ZWC7_9ACTN|nr:TIGR02466 family protein [Actinoplanes humidus]GIE22824.1 hypothetical protein Ahu01nite_059260 [Actinoplanes humidus]
MTVTDQDTTQSSAPAAVIAQTFSTPVARIPRPYAEAINGILTELVLAKAQAAGSTYTYKSETLSDLMQWDDPTVTALTDWTLQMAGQFVRTVGRKQSGTELPDFTVVVGSAWASVYRKGDQHESHFHPNTALTAIYYVTAPTTCELDLLDPRANIDYFDPGISIAGEGSRVRLRSSPGELVLFPGWVKHAVPEFDEDGTRISISWNLGYDIAGR